jgi:hypothetical protein
MNQKLIPALVSIAIFGLVIIYVSLLSNVESNDEKRNPKLGSNSFSDSGSESKNFDKLFDEMIKIETEIRELKNDRQIPPSTQDDENSQSEKTYKSIPALKRADNLTEGKVKI